MVLESVSGREADQTVRKDADCMVTEDRRDGMHLVLLRCTLSCDTLLFLEMVSKLPFEHPVLPPVSAFSRLASVTTVVGILGQTSFVDGSFSSNCPTTFRFVCSSSVSMFCRIFSDTIRTCLSTTGMSGGFFEVIWNISVQILRKSSGTH